MSMIRFTALTGERCAGYRSGCADANGLVPQRHVSPGNGAPCRHCLRDIEGGASLLILAYRPFPRLQPYAETGPIFLHGEPCERYPECDRVPDMFLKRRQILIRGYDQNDRIAYGTGAVIDTGDIAQTAARLLANPQIAYCHLRSAMYNCYQCRVERA